MPPQALPAHAELQDIADPVGGITGDRAGVMLASTPDLVWFTDAHDRVEEANAAARALLGWDVAGLRPKASSAFTVASRAVLEVDAMPQLRGGGCWSGELTLRSAGGERVATAVTMVAGRAPDGEVSWIGVVARDMRKVREFEDQMRRQVTHDPLTQLLSRAGLEAAAALALAQGSVALLLLDLDHFRTVNDALGHRVGDALLVQFAERLRTCVRPGDLLARLGGDRFVLAMPGTTTVEARAVAERVLADLRTPTPVAGHQLHLSASVGVAMAPAGHELGIATLLQDADMAMYLAKNGGRGRVEVHDDSAHQRIIARLRLRQDLYGALERRELRLLYQPIVGLADERISGVEALLRWEHPELGTISPVSFVPLLEETGLITAVGAWVLEEAVDQLGRWDAEDPAASGLTVNVNVSALQLLPGLVAEVRGALAASGIPASRVTLELTESALAAGSDGVVSLLEELRGIGVGLAIDDFGTGYSSLARLQVLPVDHLKIDRSFVQALEATGDTALIAGICQMAAALGMRLVAEGVEDAAQARTLRGLDISSGQGFLWARPLPAEEVLALLHAPGALPAR